MIPAAPFRPPTPPRRRRRSSSRSPRPSPLRRSSTACCTSGSRDSRPDAPCASSRSRARAGARAHHHRGEPGAHRRAGGARRRARRWRPPAGRRWRACSGSRRAPESRRCSTAPPSCPRRWCGSARCRCSARETCAIRPQRSGTRARSRSWSNCARRTASSCSTPPALAFADGERLAAAADAAVLVVRAGVTPRQVDAARARVSRRSRRGRRC